MTFHPLSSDDEESTSPPPKESRSNTRSTAVDDMHSTTTSQTRKITGSCHLTREDIPNIVHSVVCSIAYLIYGAGASSLGASLPSVAKKYDYSTSHVGILFTSRGVGYVVGTCTAAYLLNLPTITMSKELLTCLFLTGSGLMAFGIAIIHQFVVLNCFFLCQGFCFGAIEAIANCALPSMWGKRVQPWIQAMFACYGIGSLLGPVMVGSMNYHVAYMIIAISSLIPITILVSYDTMRQKGYSRKLDNYCICLVTSTAAASTDSTDTSKLREEPSSHQSSYHRRDKYLSIADDSSLDVTTEEGVEESSVGEDLEQHHVDASLEEENPVAAPIYITAILSCFMFFYVGIEVGFSGWITAYAIDESITSSTADAAYLSSIFWTAMTCGRMLAVVVAIYVRANIMIRVLLSLAMLSTLLAVTIMTVNYSIAAFVCALLGLAMSALFPLMITILVDYGFKIDANTSSMLIVGGTLGQSILPAFIGFVIGFTSPFAMPVIVFLSCIMLCILYFTVHYLRIGLVPSMEIRDKRRLDNSEHSSHPLTHSNGGDEYDDDHVEEVNNPIAKLDLEDDVEMVTVDFQ